LFIQILPWTITTRGNGSLYHSQCIQSAPVFSIDDSLGHEEMERFYFPSEVCLVCFDSRSMWPEDGRWFHRWDGCRRCAPCDVCSRCRVIISRSAHDEGAMFGFAEWRVFVCLDCVERDEVHQLNRNQKRRWTALKDWKATE
jgi:hypothetical protein